VPGRHRREPVGECPKVVRDGLSLRRAHKLYASEPLGVELDNTGYALDSGTIDLWRSLFDRAD